MKEKNQNYREIKKYGFSPIEMNNIKKQKRNIKKLNMKIKNKKNKQKKLTKTLKTKTGN
jgi:hypothetical protein